MATAGQNAIARGSEGGVDRALLDGPLGRRWRQAWTVLSFALFGAGTVAFGLIVAPLLWLAVWSRERRRRVARSLISKQFGFFIRFMGLFVLSWRVTGLPDPEDETPRVVVANHPTLIDAVFLMWLFPGADCVVKASHWRNPIMMFAVRAAGYLPNDDHETLARHAVERLRTGACLLMFPQGTRTRPGEEPVFRRGAAVFAARAGAELLPVRIRCTPPALRKGEPWLRVPDRRGHFDIEVLERLDPGEWTGNGQGERKGTRDLTRRLGALLLT